MNNTERFADLPALLHEINNPEAAPQLVEPGRKWDTVFLLAEVGFKQRMMWHHQVLLPKGD